MWNSVWTLICIASLSHCNCLSQPLDTENDSDKESLFHRLISKVELMERKIEKFEKSENELKKEIKEMKAKFNVQMEKVNHELEFYKQLASKAATEDRDKDSETPTIIDKTRRNSSKVTSEKYIQDTKPDLVQN